MQRIGTSRTALLALALIGCVSYAISSSSPPGGYVAMGQSGIVLSRHTITGDSQDEVVHRLIVSIISPDARGFTNYYVRNGGKLYGPGTIVGMKTNVAVEWDDPSFAGEALTIPQNTNVDFEVLADTQPWTFIQPLGIHTATSNLNVAVELTYLETVGKDNGKTTAGNPSDKVRGNAFELLRGVLHPSVNTVIPLDAAFINGARVAVFDIPGNGCLETLTFSHTYSNLQPIPITPIGPITPTMTIEVVDWTTGVILGVGQIPRFNGASVTITLDRAYASHGCPENGRDGLAVDDTHHRILYTRVNLAEGLQRISPAVLSTYQLNLNDFGWNDGTRLDLAGTKDRSFTLPLVTRGISF